MIGYFVGRTPPKVILGEWVNKSWTPHGVRLDVVQNLTKGFFFFFASLTHHKQTWSLPTALGLSVPLCLFSKNGPVTLLSQMIKRLGFLCGSSSQVYPCCVGLSLSPLPKPLVKLSQRSQKKISMLAHRDLFASRLIFPMISRILWKFRLGIKPSLRRCFI